MTSFFKIFLLSLFITSSTLVLGQAASPKKGNDGDIPKKVIETKISEVIQIVGDTATESELMKRAVNWFKSETTKYLKIGGGTTGSKMECDISFPIKPKELNPETDYTGKITMKVVIECKENRYKYTVSQLKHTSKSGNATGGSIDNVVPDCGSMTMQEVTWKKLKGEAIKDANLVVADLRVWMDKKSDEVPTEEW